MAPEALMGVNVSDMVDPFTPRLGLYVTSNPTDTSAVTAGVLSRHSLTLGSTLAGFDTGLLSIENVTFGTDGTGYISFDDNVGAGGVAVIGRMAQRSGASFDPAWDRMITGVNTNLVNPKGLEVVDSQGLLLVADIGIDGPTAGVRAFGSCASGDVAPLFEVDTAGGRPWDLHHDELTDMLFLAFTNGTVGIYDDFSLDLGAGGPDRIVTPADGGVKVSVNLHSIRYDVSTDMLILADVGDAASASDGQLFTIPFASVVDGLVQVERLEGGILSGLGNPVDIAFDGLDLYVAEKSLGAIYLYRDFLYTASGSGPDAALAVTAPDSVAFAPM